MEREKVLKKFQEAIGYVFKDSSFLDNVFIHRSYINENVEQGLVSNERLEFLGDSVLSLAISSLLYKDHPLVEEGTLTQMRSRLVNRLALAKVAKKIKLGELILLGKGERLGGGEENPALLSNTLEALIGALYLDGGFQAAYVFIEENFSELLKGGGLVESHFDFKPRLQEITQRTFKEAPVYQVLDSKGPEHKKIFTIEVLVQGRVLGSATASRKKDAEQLAAKEAIEFLQK